MNKKIVTIINYKEAKKLFNNHGTGSGNNKDIMIQVTGKSGSNKIVEVIEINPKTNKEKIIFQDLQYKKLKKKSGLKII